MAISDIGLLLRIKGDSSDAVQALNKVQRETKDLGDASSKASRELDSLTTSGGGLASLAGPASIAAAGIAAVGAAAIGVGKVLFDLANQAAEFGSAIFDASEKTGLSAETLSSLKFAADQSGSSLEAFTSATAKFAKVVGDAADGSDKAAAKLKKFGIDPQEAINDLDGSLAKVFKTIVEAEPGVAQLTLAQTAFGKSGAELLPTIKSFDGDLTKLIATAKELGLTLTDEAARSADEFGDQMDTLNKQIAAVTRIIGQELIPIFGEMARDISSWLAKNPGEIQSWANSISYWLRAVIADFKQARAEAGSFFDFLTASDRGSQAYADRQNARAVEMQRARNIKAGKDAGSGSYQVEDDLAITRAKGPIRPPSRSRAADSDDDKPKRAAARVAAEPAIKKFFEEIGATVTSYVRKNATVSGTTRPSKHATGEAVDIRTRGVDVETIAGRTAKALESGFRLFDERDKKGQPHQHYEANSTKPSRFLGADLYGGAKNLQALKDLDADRLAKKSGTRVLDRQLDENAKAEEREAKRKADLAEKVADELARSDKNTLERSFELQQAYTRDYIKELEARGEAATKAFDYDAAIDAEKEASVVRIELIKDEVTELERLAKAKQEEADKLTSDKDLPEKIKLQNEALELENKLQQTKIELDRTEKEEAAGLVKSIADITAAREEGIKALRETQKAAEDAKRELIEFRKEQERKVLVNVVDSDATNSGPQRIAALAALRDFDIAQEERRQENARKDLETEQNTSIARLTVYELEAGKREAIDALYREKALISEAEFQARKKEIENEFKEEAGVDAEGKPTRSGTSTTFDALGALGEHVGKLTGIPEILGAVETAFRGVGQAVGEAVSAFVLYGKAGVSVRQVTAQILAAIAQQAAVQAIYELAQGLAKLALAFFGVPNAGPSATAHFAAAATFGLIAGVAAVAGRAVAGDSFAKKQTSASGAFAGQTGGAGGTGARRDTANQGQSFSGQEAITRESGLNQAGGGAGTTTRDRPVIEVKFTEKPGWFANALKAEISLNGDTVQQLKFIRDR